MVGFTATDTKDDREEYDSKNTLKKLLVKTLKKTNWRLMSDGVSCRLKAYESEEDLMKTS